MRRPMLITTAFLLAGCAGDAPLTGPKVVDPVPEALASSLSVATTDAMERLVPGLAADAAGPVGAALHALSARLNDPTAGEAAVRSALTTVVATVTRFTDPDRADAATLAAITLELAAAQ